MRPLGIEYIVRHMDDYEQKEKKENLTYPELVSFLKKNFNI